MTRAIITFVCSNSVSAETLAMKVKEFVQDQPIAYSNLGVSFVANYQFAKIPQNFADGSSPSDYEPQMQTLP